MATRWHTGMNVMIAALFAILLLPGPSAQAQDAAPSAAPTTPVWTVPPSVNSSAAPQPPSSQPRYAVMADGPSAPPQPLVTPPPMVERSSPPPAPAQPVAPVRANRSNYSVMTPPPAEEAAPGRAASLAGPGSAYMLGTGDKLRVTVYGEPDLSGEFEVDSSGDVRLPLIGQVRAAGMSVHDFEQRVTAKLAAGYLRSPQVSAEVTAYRPFFIIGEVNKPGQYAYVNGMNVVTAVALAGGYTYRADESDVYVRRDGTSKEVERPADETTRIRPGDIIRVTERFF